MIIYRCPKCLKNFKRIENKNRYIETSYRLCEACKKDAEKKQSKNSENTS